MVVVHVLLLVSSSLAADPSAASSGVVGGAADSLDRADLNHDGKISKDGEPAIDSLVFTCVFCRVRKAR